jgi:hypothetical protein
VHVPGFKPGAETGVEDFRLAVPEIWLQAALNLEMIQLQLNARNAFGKVAPDIVHAHMQSGDAESPALCFDDHSTCRSLRNEISLSSCGKKRWLVCR